MAATAVTPTGVRDGDPDALAGLCDVRGPAVLAYCEVVAGRGDRATAAAADALGTFRAGVVLAGDLATLNPEALLISATRHSAARYASMDVPEACACVPGLLAARAERSITLADHVWLDEHLASCWTCRAPVARFKVADNAYSEPPDAPLPAEVKAAMVAAMTAAAPIRRETSETLAIAGDGVGDGYTVPAAPATNGNSAHAQPEQAPPAEESYTAYDLPALDGDARSPLDQPTSAYQLPPDDLEPSNPSELSPEARRARRRRTRTRGGILGALGASGRKQSRAEPAASPTGRPARTARTDRRSRPARGSAAPATAAAALAAETSAPDGLTGASLPRPRRQLSGAASNRRRGLLRPAVVLPVALVVIAIIVALVVAGVFGGGEPASVPQSLSPAPSDAPTSTQAAPVVVVPGAGAANAAAVEKAKARARAAKNKKKKQAAAATTTPAASGAGATTAPAPPPAANPAPPPPPAASPAKSNGSSGGKPKIDAGNGATGAEQLPPAKDTSTVPDLAPPVAPVSPPG